MRELKRRFKGLMAIFLVVILSFGQDVFADNKPAMSSQFDLQVGDKVIQDSSGGCVIIENIDEIKAYSDCFSLVKPEWAIPNWTISSDDVAKAYRYFILEKIPDGYSEVDWIYSKSNYDAGLILDVEYAPDTIMAQYGSINLVPNTYIIKYMTSNGELIEMGDADYSPSGAPFDVYSVPEKAGNTLTAWKIEGKNYPVADGIPASLLRTKANGATIEATAVYTPNKTIVKYNANGGSGSMSADEYSYSSTAPSKITLKANKYTRAGYEFAGWSTKSDGSKIVSSVDASYTKQETVVEVYAVWKKLPSTVSTTFEMPQTPYTIDGKMGKNDYYKTKVVITPADGYLIKDSADGEYTDSLTLNKSFTGKKIYLYQKANGCESGAIDISDMKIDSTAPKLGDLKSGKSYYEDEHEITITDTNLTSVKVNDEEVKVSNNSAKISLASNNGFEEYTILAVDKAGNETKMTVTICAPWMESNIVPVGQTVRLKEGMQYNLGDGVWKVQGDTTSYAGGTSFYINADGEFEFEKVQ